MKVQQGLDHFLFNLLVLGSLTDSDGYVWCRMPHDLYLIENMPLMQKDVSYHQLKFFRHIFAVYTTYMSNYLGRNIIFEYNENHLYVHFSMLTWVRTLMATSQQQ